MKLKKIEIIGFKSFADRTVIEFHDGITGIVGPNGCGKSNISDSFRWVLGEQSAKSMRGNKMYDVIFAGTSTRKPLNMAEVTITICNKEGLLPIEYDEVSVTRRIHRSGESDYFINKRHVRLKDLHDLFLDSGIGKNSFAIFEQGKLDQVINYNPLERRYIFEEAAGILRFLQRKREALRKLDQTDSNLDRVRDIHREVEKQIIVLEEQAEKAREFKENRSELEELELALFAAKWDRLHQRAEEALLEQQKQQAIVNENESGLEEHEKSLKEAREQLMAFEKNLQAKNEALYQARSDKEIKTQEQQSQMQRLQEAVKKERDWSEELERLSAKRMQRKLEADEIRSQFDQVEEEMKTALSVRDEHNSILKHLEDEVHELREKQGSSQRELLSFLQQEKQYESEYKQNSVRLEHNREREGRIEERLKEAESSIKEYEESLATRQNSLSGASESVSELKAKRDTLESLLQELQEGYKSKRNSLDEVRQSLHEQQARQKVLLRLREEMEGFSKATKRLLQENGKNGSPLCGRIKGLYEMITSKDGSEEALSTILRPYAQTLVVETQEDFDQVIAFAKEQNLKEFSLICTEHLPNDLSETITDPSVVSLQTKVNPSRLANHFLKNIYLAESNETAYDEIKKHPGMEIWIQSGIFLDRNRVAFYPSKRENSPFLREAELKSLEESLKVSESQLSSLQTEIQEIEQQRELKQEEKKELEKHIREAEMQLVEAEFSLKRLRTDLEKARQELEQRKKDKESLVGANVEIEAKMNELQEKHAEAKAKAEAIQASHEELQSNLDAQVEQLRTAQAGMQEKVQAAESITEKQRKLKHDLHVLEVKDIESVEHEKRLQEEIDSSKKMQEEIREKSGEYESILLEVEERLQAALEQNRSLEQEVLKKREGIEEIEQRIHQSHHGMKQLEENLYEAKMKVSQLQSAREALETELFERRQLTVEEIDREEYKLEEAIDKSERKLRGLRRSIEAAGDINMTSIEEFDKHKVRYEFLSQQIDDLEKSKTELVEIITQLDGESRKIFQETFETVRNNFKKNFQILFNGGEADLEFTETEDILEAGIEITAKPPGKQMRSIQLLSGGEKCLTALALLFAIFEVRPAPFCILDEIDAPLDDTNVKRFLNVVQQFVDRCQFIIITHNKGTMGIADILFGVSMQEKGVSKLLSIEFSEEKKPEPAMV